MNKLMLAALVCVCGCDSGSPAYVAGTYTLALTMQQNDCGILGNSVGESSTGVSLVVTQSGADVRATVQGVAGLALGLSMGSDTFTGTVSGDALDLWIAGTMSGSSGTCAYTRNAHLVAKLSGDVLTGTVTYTFASNKTADCGFRDTCQDMQLFTGARPPAVSS